MEHILEDEREIVVYTNDAALFDQYGRRIPYMGLRVYSQVSRRNFFLNQPLIDYQAAFAGAGVNMAEVSAERFQEVCEKILEGLQTSDFFSNLTRGVRVPFLCPPKIAGEGRGTELLRFVKAAGESFQSRFPSAKFYNIGGQHLNDNLGLASESRYDRFEQAREQGFVAGWWFPNCLSEYDIGSQRAQMNTLPETVKCGDAEVQVVLSGGVEAAAALAGTPDLFYNSTNYPHTLCLSALKESGEEIFIYDFEADGRNLVFTRRSNRLLPATEKHPAVPQLSEQWAGGLTVFTALR